MQLGMAVAIHQPEIRYETQSSREVAVGKNSLRKKSIGGIVGVAVGDALGVPVEFMSRSVLKADQVTDMLGHGTHNQPKGTWSDDSSLTFCLVESLCSGFDLQDIGRHFVRWVDEGYWTPYGNVFDIGNVTSQAISKLRTGITPTQAGGAHERSNGNGSLMRILPVALYFANSEAEELLTATHEVSCLTHAHPRSQMACGFYNMMIVELLKGKSQQGAYFCAVESFVDAYNTPSFSSELSHFHRLLQMQIHEEPEDTVNSSGYVVHTLESSMWAFLRSSSFDEAVLSAINLGEDTDTTGAVAGGLAGVYYGLDAIPGKWVEALARSSDVLELC